MLGRNQLLQYLIWAIHLYLILFCLESFDVLFNYPDFYFTFLLMMLEFDSSQSIDVSWLNLLVSTLLVYEIMVLLQEILVGFRFQFLQINLKYFAGF